MTAAWDRGATFFDNTEGYVHGKSERVVGKDLKELGWARAQCVVSAWIFWGGQIPNEKGLSFKHIAEGVNRSLRNFEVEIFLWQGFQQLTPAKTIANSFFPIFIRRNKH